MAPSAVKYTGVILTLCVFCGALYLIDYHSIRTEIPVYIEANVSLLEDRSGKPFREYFRVNRYKINNDILQLFGAFNEIDNASSSLNVSGISDLLQQIKPHALKDVKFERAELQHEHFFKHRERVTDVDCKAIFRGDETEIERAVNLTNEYTRKYIMPSDYLGMTSNCANFKLQRGYITESLTEFEKNFSVAYSLLMFKDVEQSERLLRAIYRPEHIYCIHVDSKSEQQIYDAMAGIAGCFDNVFMAPKRVDVQWGTFSVLEPELMCMEELLKRNKTWKYFINLTGQEFPLRTNYELIRILQIYNGANDVEGTRKRANANRWATAGDPPHNITATKGSVHVVVNRGFVDFALHNQKAKDFLEWSKNTWVPDETFFASLNHNPHLGAPGAYQGMAETDIEHNIKPFVARFKNWGDYIYNWPCAGKRVRMICVLATGDLPLLATRPEMFANKFHLDYHPLALDCLEELHFNHTRDQYLGTLGFDARWYSELGFVTNSFR